MTRVVAGVAKGRRLAVPEGGGTRPTSDRVREALFSTVTSWLGDLTALRVLDLYAGSGAVGFEALSRGAGHALLVDRDPRAVRALRRNAADLDLPGAVVRPGDVATLLAVPPHQPYDLAFVDPPYAEPAQRLERVLALLVDWLHHDALLVVERAARDPQPRWPLGWAAVDDRRYGDTRLWYVRRDLTT